MENNHGERDKQLKHEVIDLKEMPQNYDEKYMKHAEEKTKR